MNISPEIAVPLMMVLFFIVLFCSIPHREIDDYIANHDIRSFSDYWALRRYAHRLTFRRIAPVFVPIIIGFICFLIWSEYFAPKPPVVPNLSPQEIRAAMEDNFVRALKERGMSDSDISIHLTQMRSSYGKNTAQRHLQ